MSRAEVGGDKFGVYTLLRKGVYVQKGSFSSERVNTFREGHKRADAQKGPMFRKGQKGPRYRSYNDFKEPAERYTTSPLFRVSDTYRVIETTEQYTTSFPFRSFGIFARHRKENKNDNGIVWRDEGQYGSRIGSADGSFRGPRRGPHFDFPFCLRFPSTFGTQVIKIMSKGFQRDKR